MKEIVILEAIYDYVFTLTDKGNIIFHKETGAPSTAEREKIESLLETIKALKDLAAQFLKTRTVEDEIKILNEVAKDIEMAARRSESRGDLAEARRLWKQHGRVWALIEPIPTGLSWDEFCELSAGVSSVGAQTYEKPSNRL